MPPDKDGGQFAENSYLCQSLARVQPGGGLKPARMTNRTRLGILPRLRRAFIVRSPFLRMSRVGFGASAAGETGFRTDGQITV